MLDITFVLQLSRITIPRSRKKSVSRKRPFFRYIFGQAKKAMYHPCLAGPDPASHPVKPVGTQRVALNKRSMRLRVKARKDTENEYVDKCDSP